MIKESEYTAINTHQITKKDEKAKNKMIYKTESNMMAIVSPLLIDNYSKHK